MYFDNQPIIADFNRFVDYIRAAGTLELTKATANLRAVDLLKLNGQMLQPVAIAKNKPTYKDFVLLTAFYHIGLVADLWSVRRNARGNCLVAHPARMTVYDQMTDDERYGFLLQAYWCYFDEEAAFDDRGGYYFLSELLQKIKNFKVNKPNAGSNSIGLYRQPKYLMVLLAAFGIFELSVTPEKGDDRYILIKTLTLTEIGKKILSVLGSDQLLMGWRGLDPRMTTERWEKINGRPEPGEDIPDLSDFFAQFKAAFPEWKVVSRLFPVIQTVVTGVFTLKITLNPQCYRVIEMHSDMTLEDLHLAIQRLFDFGNDHLYAFYLNGQSLHRRGNVFGDPRGSFDWDEYPSDLFALGELGLLVGQRMLYIFDFGDYWEFYVEIVDFTTAGNKPDGAYKLVKSVGDAPDQYRRFEA